MTEESKIAWLDSQKAKTRGYYKGWFAYFEEFAKMTADEMLADVKTKPAGTYESKILAFKEWLRVEKHRSDYTATAMAMAVRSFFSYHRVALQFRTAEKKRLNERSRSTEDYLFTLDDIRRLDAVADLEERYVLIVGKSLALRAGDFLRLTRSNLETHINNEVPISIGRIETGKEKIPAYPFLDSDAVPVVKAMLAKIALDGKTKPTDQILAYADEISLTRALQRLAKRAGLEIGSRRVRFHNLRKFLIDRVSSVTSESKWKLIVGKKISESAYVSPEGLREDYKRVMPETCFTIGPSIEERAREAAKAEFEKLMTPEQRAITD